MSLKGFHLIFIIASILLSSYFAGWCLANELPILGLASAIVGILLLSYLVWFLRKIGGAKLALLLGPLLFYAHPVFACSACVGNPNSSLTLAANRGILFLLLVIGFVLVSFASLFMYWAIRSRNKVLPKY